MSVLDLSLTELSDKIRSKEVSPTEVAEAALTRIADTEPAITAYVTVAEDLARRQAAEAEAAILRGEYLGPLHGIPYAAKDLYDTAGIRTTASSRVRQDHVPDSDAAAVTRLRDAGMVLVGKTGTHEFAYGALTSQSGNPWDTTRTTGGSSGGSGAAVAAGTVHVALGTDTGGSIRIPAALCGTVGLKPTYGRVSRSGIASLSWSLDHAGPLTRNVIDAALVLDAMTGHDPRDPGSVDLSTSVPDSSVAASAHPNVTGLHVGVPTNFYTENLTDDLEDAHTRTIDLLRELGAVPVEVTVPYADPASRLTDLHRTIFVPEMSAYHMRTMRDTPELFTDEVRTANEAGETILAVDYINAQRWRTRMKAAWQDMFSEIDVLVAPTVVGAAVPRATPEFRWEDGTVEPGTDAYIRFNCPVNLVGLPSLQVPNGFTTGGLPTGVQVIGRPFDEATIVGVGLALEAHSEHVGQTARVV